MLSPGPRRLTPEILDQQTLNPREHAQALRGLRRLNAIGGSHRIVWRPIRDLALRNPGRTLRLLDLATGSGDVPLRLARLARRQGIALEVRGCDVNPESVRLANERAERSESSAWFFVRDVLQDPLPQDYDVLTCSLFLHHLEDAQARQLLSAMAAATRQLMVVHDLLRTGAGILLTRCATRLMSRSYVVHHDGDASVRAAFSWQEINALAASAGLAEGQITRHWPERFRLVWQKAQRE